MEGGDGGGVADSSLPYQSIIQTKAMSFVSSSYFSFINLSLQDIYPELTITEQRKLSQIKQSVDTASKRTHTHTHKIKCALIRLRRGRLDEHKRNVYSTHKVWNVYLISIHSQPIQHRSDRTVSGHTDGQDNCNCWIGTKLVEQLSTAVEQFLSGHPSLPAKSICHLQR